jgi:hypothetical protein
MERLSDELLARLRVGDSPCPMSAENEAALMEVEVIWGVALSAPSPFHYWDANRIRNRTIDLLDERYPRWRGWDVPTGRWYSHV